MARPTAKGIDKPDDDVIAKEGKEDTSTSAGGDDAADLEGYTGPDGSKSLGYLKHAPVEDSSGLGTDADDAGRTTQEPGQNSGAGAPQNESKR